MSAAGLPERCWTCPADRCTTHTLYDHLDNHDLLVGNYSLSSLDDDERDAELTRRDRDRYRILKRLTSGDSTFALKTIVSECVKGQPVGQCERFDGSDADYRFVHRYITELSERDPPLVRKRKTAGTCMVSPTPRLIDLITQGITQTQGDNPEVLYDRDFARDILEHSNSLTGPQKKHLENSLESYVDRVNDYKLLFDVTTYGADGHGASTSRMTKDYKTRFNDRGRIAKNYAQFNQALQYNLDHASNAVLCTLTSDPGTKDDPSRPNPRSLMRMISTINENHNRLMAYLKSDPSMARDTRREDTPQWTPERDPGNYHYFTGEPTGGAPDGPVTGRPRQKLEYIKVLEFTDAGYPHLHILFFDVPTRDSDGMSWLIDKNELSAKWSDYGQGMIVDTYPLIYRDDLDQLGDFGTKTVLKDGEETEVPVSEGMVDWYQYGDHDHSDEWIANQKQAHNQIEFSEDDETSRESTAGAYLGKYLSATFGALMTASDGLTPNDGTHEDKAETWKLALYWATERRFWSLSQHTRLAISPNEHIRDDADCADAVRWCSTDTIQRLAYQEQLDTLAKQRVTDPDALDDRAEAGAEKAVTPNVESTLPESSDFGIVINYVGAYAYWDLPTQEIGAPTLDTSAPRAQHAQDLPPDPRCDRPPPIAQAFDS